MCWFLLLVARILELAADAIINLVLHKNKKIVEHHEFQSANWPVEYMIQWLNCSSIELPCLGSSTFLWSVISTPSSSILAPKLDKMSGLGFQMHSKFPSHRQVIIPSLISCIFVIISQFALAMVPRYFSFSPLLVQLSLSAILLLFVTGLGRICRRLVRVYASAPAFVFFNIFFIWGFHLSVIRKAIPLVTDIVFNVECALLMVGFRSILYRDPGRVLCGDSTSDTFIESEITQVIAHSEEEELSPTGICLEHPRLIMDENVSTRRMRYCKSCKAYIRGYDHHCPAFGNCIGKKNHVLFMVLLIGFVMVEASYVVSTNQFITKSWIMDKTMLETSLLGNLVISTMLFSLLQVIWQVIFLTWHIYCICVNIRTDEWVNWKIYPEFQHVQSQPGQSFPAKRFTNPYNKGVINNIKELLLQR